MSDYIEPTQTEFNNAEGLVQDAVTAFNDGYMTRAGSAIRELLVRPMAYLTSWFGANRDADDKGTSVAELKKSTLTENAYADRVAANYFVTRKGSSRASGTLSVRSFSTVVRLTPASQFYAASSMLHATGYIYAALEEPDALPAGYTFVQMVPNGNTGENVPLYSFAIAVEALDDGDVEILPGTEVSAAFQATDLHEIRVLSAISGGKAGETDAELMARAELTVADSGSGTYFGLGKRLLGAPVTVLSHYVMAGEEPALFRARNNTVNVNPGGIVDLLVKTSTQAHSAYMDAVPTYSDSGSVRTWTVPALPTAEYEGTYAGIISVTEVTVSGTETVTLQRTATGSEILAAGQTVTYGDVTYSGGSQLPSGTVIPAGTTILYNDTISNLTVSYTSSAGAGSADLHRLSRHQRVSVTFTTGTGVTISGVRAFFTYIPGIADIQDYISEPANSYIGQDILVKAAVPVRCSLSASYEYDSEPDDAVLATVKEALASYVNSLPVGRCVLNFSDLDAVCRNVAPGIRLRLPCILTAAVPLKTGITDSLYSNTGILDISLTASTRRWAPQIYFLSMSASSITLSEAL